MKACILAGGEGRRLRPLTSHLPKPLVPILGKPVLHRIIEQLRALDISDMAVTLMYLPETIRDSLGDGSEWNANLHFYEEKQPLGTAGGVGACRNFLSDDDFVVISGDAICDFDLSEAFRFHREHRADVTIVLNRQENPLEYGLVHTDHDGRILRFAEKPTWGEVFTDVVNTGIYILAPHILNEIPSDRPYDFSKDLFPDLLARGARLFGCELRGYWCDIGDTAAFLRCSIDGLNGTVRLSASESTPYKAPEGVTIRPPVQIDPLATVMPGATIGPNVWLGAHSYVGEGAIVEDSVVWGTLAAQCEVIGAIVCAGSHVGTGTLLRQGAVVGGGARIGVHCQIGCDVRIYPDVTVADGTNVRSTLTAGDTHSLAFEDGTITGSFGSGLTPEVAAALGAACAAVVDVPRVALGAVGGADAQSIAQSLLGGLTAAGCSVYTHDATFAAGAAEMVYLLGVPLSIFVDSDDELTIRFYGADGLSLSSALQRKIEGTVARGEGVRVSSPAAGRQWPILGTRDLFAASIGGKGSARKLQVAVHGHHPAAIALAATLSMAGFSVSQTTTLSLEGLDLSISRDGFHFTVGDPNCRFDCRATDALVYLAAMLESPKQVVILAEDAPEAYERMAAEQGATVRRCGRDDGAAADFATQVFSRNAIAAAVFLLNFLDTHGTPLEALKKQLPSFGVHSESIICTCERGALMRRLAESEDVHAEVGAHGLCMRNESGVARIRPGTAKYALKIFAEGFSEEIAKELAIDLRKKAEQIGREMPV
ncbi:MAG: NTP transferase domain-containing protein [Clostridia bacterium]|nr:NTP transferase domain-containing protein [Clostridia bacterium]